jgi:hypothetical protein
MAWIAVPTWLAVMTEADGSTTHWVTEEQVLAPLDGGRSRAVCGRTFLPAALVTPPGRPCCHCRRALRPPARRAVRGRPRLPILGGT